MPVASAAAMNARRAMFHVFIFSSQRNSRILASQLVSSYGALQGKNGRGPVMSSVETKVLVPAGALGIPYDRAALAKGLEAGPDLIAIDGGSTDSGPHYLGTGTSKYSRSATKGDWAELMAARATALEGASRCASWPCGTNGTSMRTGMRGGSRGCWRCTMRRLRGGSRRARVRRQAHARLGRRWRWHGQIQMVDVDGDSCVAPALLLRALRVRQSGAGDHGQQGRGTTTAITWGIFPDREVVQLAARKGFCKHALRTGAPVVPVYIFGQTQLFYTVESMDDRSCEFESERSGLTRSSLGSSGRSWRSSRTRSKS